MIKVYHRNSAYRLRLSNLINEDDIWFKFDTGAINTIISLEALVNSKKLQSFDKKIFIENLRKEILTKDFTSASGNGMKGYLCKATNVRIGSTVFKQFYYYLIVDIKYPIALLGDDFISCCSFTHSANSDIIINGFDAGNYYTIKQNTYVLSEDEISLALLDADDEVRKANYIKVELEKEGIL